MRTIIRQAASDGAPKHALVTSAIVGTILVAINHGDTILAGHMPPYIKIVLTYLVPYCVMTFGAVSHKRTLMFRERRTAQDR